jgi:hypothetical protein
MEEGDGYKKDNTKAKNPWPSKKAGFYGALPTRFNRFRWFILKKHIPLDLYSTIYYIALLKKYKKPGRAGVIPISK